MIIRTYALYDCSLRVAMFLGAILTISGSVGLVSTLQAVFQVQIAGKRMAYVPCFFLVVGDQRHRAQQLHRRNG